MGSAKDVGSASADVSRHREGSDEVSRHSAPMGNQGESQDLLQTVSEPLHQWLQRQADERSTFVEQPAVLDKGAPAEPEPFRPWDRQPLALLTILDDGHSDRGEEIRIRSSSVVIGRSKGDIRIPFDPDISSEHAELRCRLRDGHYRWHLLDRKSRNGTFVRAYRASLHRDTDLILGGRLYRFRPGLQEDENEDPEVLRTRAYEFSHGERGAELVELGRLNETGKKYSVAGAEARLGSDSSCDIVIEGDPYLSKVHVRFYQDDTRRWMLEDLKSRNGVWVRIRRLRVDNMIEFQLGQQRFRFEPRLG